VSTVRPEATGLCVRAAWVQAGTQGPPADQVTVCKLTTLTDGQSGHYVLTSTRPLPKGEDLEIQVTTTTGGGQIADYARTVKSPK
jgi:hypothetical protein